MKKQDKIFAIVLVCLIVGFCFQQARIEQLIELNENIPISNTRDWGATITFSVYRDNSLISEETHHNLITDAGRSALRGHIADTTVNVWKYIAIGTSTGGGTGSTTLVSEYLRAIGVYATVGSFNFSLIFTWTEGNFSGQTITEYGLFNDPTTGTMLSYGDDFSRGPLLADDTLEIIVMFQIGS